jgi:phasin family protein
MANQNPFADLFKNFSEFKAPSMPTLDMTQLLNAGRKNAEAVTAAGQTLADSAQTITRRQAELARTQVEKVLKTTKEMLVNGSPEINTTKQVEFAKTLFETSLNNIREVSELVTKSGFEAFDVLNRRASQTIEEFSNVKTASSNTASKKKAA